MSMRQGTGLVKGSGSSVQGTGVRVTSASSGGHYGGGAGGCFVGSHRGGNMSIGGGHGFSSGSGIVGGAYGFGGGAGYGAAGFGSGSGFGGGTGYGDAGFGAGSGFGSGLGFSGSSGFGLGGGSGFEFGGGHGGFGENQGVFNINEKMTMQNLNDRLAAYLAKVQTLEEVNAELEKKIHQWYQSQKPKPTQDYSHYFKVIEELQKKIQEATVSNGQIILQVDNARLTADDFKLKYENEQYLRHAVESDINGLKRVLDELKMTKSDLESQLNSLKEELDALKRNFEEEIKAQREQTQGDITVDMEAAPAINLQKALEEMRQEYESIVTKNKKQIEDWYHVKQDEMKHQMTKDSQEIKTSGSEVTELRRSVQNLEIEFQAQISMKTSLEGTMAETEGRYCMQLAQIQEMIHNVEMELSNIRCDLENQSQEYKILLDIKTRLEQEIATYRSLMEGQGTQLPGGSYEHSSSYSSGSTSDKSGGSYNVRIRTEDSDGRVTSTRDQPYQPGYRK